MQTNWARDFIGSFKIIVVLSHDLSLEKYQIQYFSISII